MANPVITTGTVVQASSGVGNKTVTMPSSSSGNIIGIYVQTQNPNNIAGDLITITSGYTLLSRVRSGASNYHPECAVFYKVSNGSEPSTVTYAHAGIDYSSLGTPFKITGQHASTPFGTPTTANSAGTDVATLDLPTISYSTDSITVALFGGHNGSATQAGTDLTMLTTTYWSAAPMHSAVGYENQTTSGSTGTVTTTWTTAGRATGIMVEVKTVASTGQTLLGGLIDGGVLLNRLIG